MKNHLSVSTFALLLAFSVNAGNSHAADSNIYPNAHGSDDASARFRGPGVTDLVFSPDGKWLVASYFRHAMNRPGTDWHIFTALWNLETKKRTIFWKGSAPIAFSPNGKTLAMGVYVRSRTPGFRMSPQTKLALWKVGESKPFQVLTHTPVLPEPDKKPLDRNQIQMERDRQLIEASFPLAAVFVDNHRVISLNANGNLIHWRISADPKESASSKVLDKIDSELLRRGWRWRAAPIRFTGPTKIGTTKAGPTKTGQLNLAISGVRVYGRSAYRRITWSLDLKNTKAKRIEDKKHDADSKAAPAKQNKLGQWALPVKNPNG